MKIISLALSILLCLPLYAQIHDFDSLIQHDQDFRKLAGEIGDTMDLFNNSKILEVTLQSDFKNLVKQKMKDEYQDAFFWVMYNDTVQVRREIKIKPRGHMRKSTCFIPPLKLNFPKKDAYIKQLEQFDKLKMVLDCKRGNIYEQYLLSEYYAYRIHNAINDFSLRVRLLRVSYIDTSDKIKNVTRYAFIIENIDQLAKRNNAVRIEINTANELRTHVPTLADGYLFQYLIGNTDWSIRGMHNVYIVKSMDIEQSLPYVIPYDFDYAGIVNTMYAIPNEELGLENVRERLYRGRCIPEEAMMASRDRFISAREQIYQLYEQDQFMSKHNKKSTVSYLDEFYNMIEKEASFRRTILENCR